jgi:hypothetical protein
MKSQTLSIIRLIFIGIITSQTYATNPENYTQLNPQQYRQIVNNSRATAQELLNRLTPYRQDSRNTQVALIAEQLTDIPYSRTYSTGEGDWQPRSLIYKPGALHLNQNPVYRFDYFNCQTLVQTTMALLYSHNLNQFDANILKISYGAAGNPQGEIVHYYNRNHFVDADMNPINEQHGWLIDVTTNGDLAAYAKTTAATLTRQNWFLAQQKNLAHTIYVLDNRDANAMIKRFYTVYTHLNLPHFDKQITPITYIPKLAFLVKESNGSGYTPNQNLLDAIPTPAVVEIVSDPKKWMVHHENIKTHIGTELNIPHLGLLYRKTFHHGEAIYQHIYCGYDTNNKKACTVTPVMCQKTQCDELMFVHATDGHPEGYYWYQEPSGQYVCTSHPPSNSRHYTTCNRVENIPLIDYLTDYQYDHYRQMGNPAILGLHFEKLQ